MISPKLDTIKYWVLLPLNLWIFTVTIPFRICFSILSVLNPSKNIIQPQKDSNINAGNRSISQHPNANKRRVSSFKQNDDERFPSFFTGANPQFILEDASFPHAHAFVATEYPTQEFHSESLEDERTASFVFNDVKHTETTLPRCPVVLDDERTPSFVSSNYFKIKNAGTQIHSEQTPIQDERMPSYVASEYPEVKHNGPTKQNISDDSSEIQNKKVKLEHKEDTKSKTSAKKPVSKTSTPSKTNKAEKTKESINSIDLSFEEPLISQKEKANQIKDEQILELQKQISDLEQSEKKLLQEKLEMESSIENQQEHMKEGSKKNTKEKKKLRKLASDKEKQCFDLQQQLISLRSQLHSHGDYKLDDPKNIKSAWKTEDHQRDFTDMVKNQQFQETHIKSTMEILADELNHPLNPSSVGAI